METTLIDVWLAMRSIRVSQFSHQSKIEIAILRSAPTADSSGGAVAVIVSKIKVKGNNYVFVFKCRSEFWVADN